MTEMTRYQLQEIIGRGGIGVVYRAWDVHLEKNVALKIVRVQPEQIVDLVAQIQQENRLLARLNQPHILRIEDIGWDAEGKLYLLMPLISGETLRDKLNTGSMNLGQFLEIMVAVAQALDAAHGQNVIHGDLKPSNILFNDRGLALVSDFGLAQFFVSPGENVVFGTPGYMSPEAARGAKIDARSDQFSLAVIVYEALTGGLPFAVKDSNKVIVPTHITRWNEQVSPALAILLEQALHEKPENRFDNLTDFVIALQQATIDLQLPLPVAKHQEFNTPIPAVVVKAQAHSPEVLIQLNKDYESGLAAMRTEDWATAIDAFRRVEEIDRHYRSAVVLRRTCERSLNNIHHRSIDPKSSLPLKVSQILDVAKPVPKGIIEGAGGAASIGPAPSRRSVWKYLFPIILILGLGIAAGVLFWPSAQQSAAINNLKTATPEIITMENAIRILTPNTRALWRMNEYNAEVTEDNLVPLPHDEQILSVLVLDGTLEFDLPDDTKVIANQGTVIVFNSFVGWKGAKETIFTIEKGKLVAASANVISIKNPFDANVKVIEGIAGILFLEEQFTFEVDCLSGSCQVRGDLGGETLLRTGDHVSVGGSGKPGSVEPAGYQQYANLAVNMAIPSPTNTSIPTGTPISTIQSTPTSTSIPTYTSIPTRRSTVTVTPTATATWQYIARPTPKISIFTCNQPGVFSTNEVIPFQWTWPGTLRTDEYLELRIGPKGSSNLNSIGAVPSDGNVVWSVAVSQFYQSTAYDYHWEIVHMAKDRKTVLARSERGCVHITP